TMAINTIDILCNVDATGSIQIVSGGGTGALSYSIDNGATFNTPANNFNFSTLNAGAYTAYVEDANGCIRTEPVTLNEPTLLAFNTVTPIDDSCFNMCVGMIAIDAQGGVLPYSYSADGVVFASNDTIFDLCDGNYTATVTDDNGCVITQPVVIAEPTEVTITLATTNETCDAANGVITATGNGGTGALTYFLNAGAGQASNVFNGIDDGNHVVMVEDIHGCSATGNVDVRADPIPLINSVALTDPLCNGSADGTATVSVTGGVGTILYSVDGGATQASNVFSALTAGAHTMEIIDDNGCTHTFPINLVDPPVLVIDNITTQDVDCNGNATGSFEVFASGGTPAYTYSFDNGATFQGSATNDFIAAGTYQVMVEDANGCQAGPTAVDILEPAVLDWNPAISVEDASCFGVCDGIIHAPTQGGTAPYSYNWSGNVAGAGDSVAIDLCAGVYGVIVTDDQGCMIQDLAVTVGEPPLLVINSSVADSVSCNGDSDGVITIDSPLGVDFEIDNGTTVLNNATGLFDGTAGGTNPGALPVGMYNITVTDAQGCEAYSNVTIYQPDSLILAMGLDITICTNIPITLSGNVTGGTMGYNYLWNTGATTPSITVSQTTDVLYDLTITDQNGCVAFDDKNILVIPPMQVDPILDDTICPGDDISYFASATLGDAPYLFTWSADNYTDTMSSVNFTPTQAVTPITLVAKDNCGTTDSLTATVYWYAYPSFDILGAQDGCV
ncbi:MAG: SprB repeat-containing protein, partial [Planctomycetota bacterium]